MSLRETIESDLSFILEDETTGFAWSITVESPDGTSEAFKGFSADIAQAVDPDTGELVSGRFASVALRISSLEAIFSTLPRGISSDAGKPWTVTFNDIGGDPWTFKVKQSNPDRTVGVVVLHLENYKAAA